MVEESHLISSLKNRFMITPAIMPRTAPNPERKVITNTRTRVTANQFWPQEGPNIFVTSFAAASRQVPWNVSEKNTSRERAVPRVTKAPRTAPMMIAFFKPLSLIV